MNHECSLTSSSFSLQLSVAEAHKGLLLPITPILWLKFLPGRCRLPITLVLAAVLQEGLLHAGTTERAGAPLSHQAPIHKVDTLSLVQQAGNMDLYLLNHSFSLNGAS